MEFVKITFYSLFFVAAAFLAVFNVLYSFRLHSTNYSLGFGMPRFLRRALEINSFIALIVTLAIALALANALSSMQIPAIF